MIVLVGDVDGETRAQQIAREHWQETYEVPLPPLGAEALEPLSYDPTRCDDAGCHETHCHATGLVRNAHITRADWEGARS